MRRPYIVMCFMMGLGIGVLCSSSLFGDGMPVMTIRLKIAGGFGRRAGGGSEPVTSAPTSTPATTQDEHEHFEQQEEDDDGECVSFGNTANYSGFPYGPCNVLHNKRADYYCECRRPFTWVHVDDADASGWPLTTEEKKGVGTTATTSSSTTRECTVGRCCYGKLAGRWSSSECAKFPMLRVDLGRELYTALDALRQLPDRATLTFFGDEVMFQTYNAWLCALSRHGAVVEQEVFRPRQLVFYESGTGSTRTVTVKIDGKTIEVVYLSEYKVHSSGLTVKEACEMSDVLVFDWGGHYHTRQDYSTSLSATIIPFMREYCFNRGVKVIFRGSAAAHYHRPAGVYTRGADVDVKAWMQREFGKDDLSHNIGCTAQRFHTAHHVEYDWKNRMAVNEFIEQGFIVRLPPWGHTEFTCNSPTDDKQLLYYVPMGELTAELWQQHHAECAQYCSTPLLWQPVWDAMYLFLAQGSPQCTRGDFPEPAKKTYREPNVPKGQGAVAKYFIAELQNKTMRIASKIYKS